MNFYIRRKIKSLKVSMSLVVTCYKGMNRDIKRGKGTKREDMKRLVIQR